MILKTLQEEGKINMKEKTFKDLGLDEGDKHLNKIGEEYDLGDLTNILDDEYDDEKEKQTKIKNIKDKV